ncbi:UDP-glucose 4-epimerase GalE [Psychrobacillus psychrodurans]|uniref:UDP-glucose 4-epimerase n=1 Tax=Psychrobacillus psychrodurans TaxID=126157 RepID=A0A9X3L6A4_9BACI|nr:UDP-glucose 4-epimerase GalE [Psychrobacillus psychrodurans]MCZ8532009.1 UDP-glucose 4-epimerase GalE [Psychrobacillus psychrodurans]
MKVLITGGLGYIGSHTVVELSNNGFECIVLDNLSNSSIKVLKDIEELCQKKIEYWNFDLHDKDELENIFSTHQFHAVIHFAGIKSPGESFVEPLRYFEENIGTTINLLKEMQRKNVKKLVFSSSATVYGDLTTPPVNEDAPTSILNPYGRTKLIIEEMLQDLSKSDPSWSIAMLRYFNPIGAHPSGRIGEKPNGIPNNLMPYITQVANGEREYLNIFGDDYPTHDGTGIRDYIHVVDLASGHLKALNYLNNQLGAHIFNLGTGKGYSVLDLVNTFEKVNNIKIPYKIMARRSGDIAVSYADVSKAEQELGWKAEHELKDMCEDAWRWEKNSSK